MEVRRQRITLEHFVCVLVAEIGECNRQGPDLGLIEQWQHGLQRHVVDMARL